MLTSDIPIFDGTVLESAYVMATVEIEPGTFRLRRVLPGQAGGGLLDTDPTLAADSDSFYPSQKAAKTYIDGSVSSGVAAEAVARAAADTTLQTSITSEASTRATADTTLQTNISTEANTRNTNDTILTNTKKAIAVSSTVAAATLNSWTARVTASANFNGGCWCPEIGTYVAVGSTALVANQVITSPDGVTWTARSSAADRGWRTAAFSPTLGTGMGRVVAVANSGVGRTMYSDDGGVTWTAGTAGTDYEDNSWLGVCWSGTKFVAVASTGTHRVMTSSDGITWTGRTAASAELWFDVAWSPTLGVFAAVAFGGSTNLAMSSVDGITWVSYTTANRTWRGIDWSPQLGLFAAVCSSGTGQRVMTWDGAGAWTQRTTPSDNNWASVAWSPELNCFISGAESGTTDRIMSSFDGLTWTARTTLNDNITRVVWSPQLLQTVLIGGTSTNRIKTSGVAAGAALTNSVTAGGTSDTIANFTDLTTYANDSAAIRNDIYQLARTLKLVQEALRQAQLLK